MVIRRRRWLPLEYYMRSPFTITEVVLPLAKPRFDPCESNTNRQCRQWPDMQSVRSCYSWRPNARPGVCDHVVYIGDVTSPPRTLALLPVVPSRPALPPSENHFATVVPSSRFRIRQIMLCCANWVSDGRWFRQLVSTPDTMRRIGHLSGCEMNSKGGREGKREKRERKKQGKTAWRKSKKQRSARLFYVLDVKLFRHRAIYPNIRPLAQLLVH